MAYLGLRLACERSRLAEGRLSRRRNPNFVPHTSALPLLPPELNSWDQAQTPSQKSMGAQGEANAKQADRLTRQEGELTELRASMRTQADEIAELRASMRTQADEIAELRASVEALTMALKQ